MQRNYKTQMQAARMGIITSEMEVVAKKENIDPETLRGYIAEGKAIIPANIKHKAIDPEGLGSMLTTKVNVNLGISRDAKDYDKEIEKVNKTIELGAHAIMDLSSHGNTQPFRQKLVEESKVMLGTVPVYDAVIHYQRDLKDISGRDFVDVIRLHAEDGVDFVTLHCGINKKTMDQIKNEKRKMNIISRGGSLVLSLIHI